MGGRAEAFLGLILLSCYYFVLLYIRSMMTFSGSLPFGSRDHLHTPSGVVYEQERPFLRRTRQALFWLFMLLLLCQMYRGGVHSTIFFYFFFVHFGAFLLLSGSSYTQKVSGDRFFFERLKASFLLVKKLCYYYFCYIFTLRVFPSILGGQLTPKDAKRPVVFRTCRGPFSRYYTAFSVGRRSV